MTEANPAVAGIVMISLNADLIAERDLLRRSSLTHEFCHAVSCHELGPGLAAVAAGSAAGASQAPAQADRDRAAPSAGAHWRQSVWSYDFVFDWCANGQHLKCLTVTDEWTREGLAIEVDGRISSGRVIEVLSRVVSERGAPLYLRSDNGPEFVSRALLKWIVDQGRHPRQA